MTGRTFISWSGGKDSSLAFYKAVQSGVRIEALLTSVNAVHNRISMHGVRRELLEAQAASLGLPLYNIELPEHPGMAEYEAEMNKALERLKSEGFTQGLYGDIFLEDLKAYREEQLSRHGLRGAFPLWKQDSRTLMREFTEAGFKAVTVCVNRNHLAKSFCGRPLDESFVNDLPATADPCGENGEYHSFVFDGPIFSKPVAFQKGEVVYKEYPSPALRHSPDEPGTTTNAVTASPSNQQDDNDDCFTAPQPAASFWFQDLVIG